ncbi:MAG TPA: hypothetical protein VGV13_16205 [Methylomirabilota bacterium]|jgi:hypothetical protein|nr:hypothetical protein [Methylomirabilota bacterium]
MDQDYPAWKVTTEPKLRDINRHVERDEMEAAYAHAHAAGLWRFDRRWRSGVDRLWTRLCEGQPWL